MREQFREIATNLTPVRVVGVPGLTLVLIAVALAMQFPEARWLIVAGVGGGAAVAAVLITRRRTTADRDGGGPSNDILTISERTASAVARDRAAGDHNREMCVAVA